MAVSAHETLPAHDSPLTSRASPAIALTVAGSDPSGGAGIQADLRTFSAFGVYGAAVLTALTAQNTTGVKGVMQVPGGFIAEQVRAVLADLDVGAVKTGMLGNAEAVRAVVAELKSRPAVPLIVDPVMVSTSGDTLLAEDAIAAVREELVPIATLITPNLPEAARLLGRAVARDESEQAEQAEALLALGARAVLLKGGHATSSEAVDLLVERGGTVRRLADPRIDTRNTHGTGCTLSAAIAALMAGNRPLEEAVVRAKSYVWRALEAGRALRIGHGRGPVDHLFAVKRQPPPA